MLTKFKIDCVDSKVSNIMIEAMAHNLIEQGYDWGIVAVLLYNYRSKVYDRMAKERKKLRQDEA